MLTGAPSRYSINTRPRGGVYVAVLGMSMLVLVLGLGGLASARAISRTRADAGDLSGARWAASSGVELARYAIERDPTWRSVRSNGDWFSDVAVGSATVSVSVNNPNGAMGRLPNDPVEITARAYQGSTVHTARLMLDAQSTPYSALDVPLTAGGAITATSATVHASGYTIATNLAFTALLCNINANVEAGLTAVGLTVNGTSRSLAGTRSLPGADAFDYYLANGTYIPGTSLPLRSGARTISNTVLSPVSNYFNSALNSRGIYVIDAGNQVIAIGPCRIVGTLVIINANGAVRLQSTILAEPAVSNFPCIMVRGDANITATSDLLTEGAGTPNYNPSNVPYPWPNGVSNGTIGTTESYDSAINGLVYISQNASVSGSPTINQLVVGGALSLGGTLTLGYTSEYRRNPPPGFSVIRMRPRAGDRRQVVE